MQRRSQSLPFSRSFLCALLATALASSGVRAAATNPGADTDEGPDATAADAGPDDASGAKEPDPEETTAEPTPADPPHTISGVAGNPTRASKEEAGRAQGELEGQVGQGASSSAPDRMPPLETAAWWTAFGTVALATMAGVFSGLAEKKEDEATRLATQFDPDTGQQAPYSDQQREYEELLDKGNTYQWTARGFLIASGIGLVATITLFAVNAKRSRRKGRRAKLGPTSLEVSF